LHPHPTPFLPQPASCSFTPKKVREKKILTGSLRVSSSSGEFTVLSFELREVLVDTQIHTSFLPQALLPLAFLKKTKTKQNKKCVEKKNLTHLLTQRLLCSSQEFSVVVSFELRVVEQLVCVREREGERERELGYTISLLRLTTKNRVCLNNTHHSKDTDLN
jgi:hypothetical protein